MRFLLRRHTFDVSRATLGFTLWALFPLVCVGGLRADKLEFGISSCYEVRFTEELGWPRSGAWVTTDDGHKELLIVDTLRRSGKGQVLAISTDGKVLPGFGVETGVGFKNHGDSRITTPQAPSHIHPNGRQGFVILDHYTMRGDESKFLYINDRLELARSSPIQGAGIEHKATVTNKKLQIEAIYDMAPMGEGLLAFADYREITPEQPNGLWGSAFLYLGAAGKNQLVYSIDPDSDVVFQYAREMPYLAAVNGVGFILFMDQKPTLAKVKIGADGIDGVEMLENFPEEFRYRPHLVRQFAMDQVRQLKQYYTALEDSTLGAGIYSWSGELYLLGKKPAESNGDTAWWLIRLDQDTGDELSRVRLPTDAPHLIVVPGDHWAFVQMGKGRVEDGLGPQNSIYFGTRSMVVVPNDWLADPYAGRLDEESRAHCDSMP